MSCARSFGCIPNCFLSVFYASDAYCTGFHFSFNLQITTDFEIFLLFQFLKICQIEETTWNEDEKLPWNLLCFFSYALEITFTNIDARNCKIVIKCCVFIFSVSVCRGQHALLTAYAFISLFAREQKSKWQNQTDEETANKAAISS